MFRKRVGHSVCILLLGFTVLFAKAPASANEGVHLRFSLEPEPVTVTVSGRVTDKQTGEPVADALVRGHVVIWRHRGPDLFEKCPYQEIVTDSEGMYQLRFLTPLTTSGPMKGKDGLCVYVSAPGYETRPQYARPRVTPDATSFENFDFALGPGRLVKGTIVDEDGNPVPAARVRAQNNWNGDWQFFGALGQTSSDDNGHFELWVGPENLGNYPWLEICKPGYGAACFLDFLSKDDIRTFLLPRGGDISGKVIDVDGKGVPNCEVSVRSHWARIDLTTTDETGRYILRGIPGEPSLIDFRKEWSKRVGRSSATVSADVKVYARLNPEMNLRDVPQYEITAHDAKTVTAPDLVVGTDTSVSGKLIASKATCGLGGLMVRLDFSWDNMVEADAEGNFYFPLVSTGKHRLTAYLPHNLRYDRGIGHIEIEVEPGRPLEDLQIQLDDLAEVRVQYLDADGNPLPGITAGATWSKSGDGGWAEGTISDKDGWAVLYLYPDSVQYVRGFDHSGDLVAEGFEKVEPKAGEVINNLQVVMVPTAVIRGQFLNENSEPFSERVLLCKFDFADGVQKQHRVKTDLTGGFEIDRITPGVVKLAIESLPLEFSAELAEPFEIKPGETKDLDSIVLQQVQFYTVSGRLLPSPTFSSLQGFKIRLDLMQWEPMVTTDSDGRFVIPKASAGKHRLTAYLPFNLRTDRGVGHVDIEVKDSDLEDVELPLETLATIHMRITDGLGKPLEGIAAAAWWTEDHSGVFTEGTKSDPQGRATLYMYPDSLQYVGAHDWDGQYTLEGDKQFSLKQGDVVKGVNMIMQRASD